MSLLNRSKLNQTILLTEKNIITFVNYPPFWKMEFSKKLLFLFICHLPFTICHSLALAQEVTEDRARGSLTNYIFDLPDLVANYKKSFVEEIQLEAFGARQVPFLFLFLLFFLVCPIWLPLFLLIFIGLYVIALASLTSIQYTVPGFELKTF